MLATFAYTLVKIHEAFFTPRDAADNGEPAGTPLPGLSLPELWGCALLLGASLVIGLKPGLLTDKIVPSLKPLLERLT